MKADNTSYNKLVIYYFSGTGNARYAAQTIAHESTKKGIISVVINIEDVNDIDKLNVGKKGDLIGFCYPTHGFNAPPNMLNFIWKFPKGKANVFVLNTRAGLKLSKIHLPGIGGAALWLPAVLLKLKGYNPIGFRPLDMPSNWISLHPGVRKKVKDSIVANCTKTLDKFTLKIIKKKPVLNGFLWLPIDIILLPISFGYYFFGRFALSKTFFANYNCNNCNLCINQCPVNAIKQLNNRPYWSFSCESCMKCMNNCPQRAIETAHLFTFLLWWFVFFWAPVYFTSLLIKYQIINLDFLKGHFGLVSDIVMVIIGFPILFIAYHIFHYLLGFKFFNKLITWTSLTHGKFWRRYKLKDKKN